MLVSFTQKQFGTQYGTLKVRHQFATCATSLQFQFTAFQVTSISQIFASVFLSSLLHRAIAVKGIFESLLTAWEITLLAVASLETGSLVTICCKM